MKPRNEKTGKAVAAIAGKVLRALNCELFVDHVLIQPKAKVWPLVDVEQYFVLAQVCTVADLKALAASALTQAPDKPKKTRKR